MRYNRQRKPIFIIAAVMVLIITALFATGVFADDGATPEITSVILNKGRSEINIELTLPKQYVKENKSESVYLFEFLPYESTSAINQMEPVKTLKVSEEIAVKIPFLNGNSNRLYSKFVIAEKLADGSYSIITKAKYIENVGVLAENTEPYPTKSSKKGLVIQNFADAQQLGTAHTVITVPINEYLLGENTDGAQSFLYNGQTFYVSKAKLALLDHKVKIYTDAGINVYFNLVLTAPDANMHPNLKSLYFDDVYPSATYFAVNTKSESAMKSFQAFVDYLAAHYTRPDRAYGFVPAMILGFEVNSNGEYNNRGQMDLTNYVYSYCTAFRIVHTAMTSHYSEGRVYISLGNNFTAETEAIEGTYREYAAKDFLDQFAAVIKSSGDISWGVSVNPYPSDAALVEYWNDVNATDDADTSFITMKNIDVLTEYMQSEEMLYNSEVRSIIVGEFGVVGDPSSDTAMTMQAAAYALAYYTAAQNEHVDAFIYYNQVDGADFSGLWATKSDGYVETLAKKPIYNVFSLIDTAESENVTAFVKQTVGVGAFNLFMGEDVKYKQFNERTVIDVMREDEEDVKRGYRQKTLFDLTKGKLQSFYPSDGGEYIELRPLDDASKTMMYAKVSGVPTEYEGISNTSFDEDALEFAHYIKLRIMASAPSDAGNVSLMLRMQNDGDGENNTAVLVGEATLRPNEWNDVIFKIKDFVSQTDGNIDTLKLWIKTSEGGTVDGEYGIWLESVTLLTKGQGWRVVGRIALGLLIFVGVLILGYAVLFVRAQLIRRKRRRAAARRRQAMQRAQRQQMNGTGQIPQSRMQYPPNGQRPTNGNYPHGNN